MNLVAMTMEARNRQAEFDLAIDQAIELLQTAKGRPASTHLGLNLANRATDLSAIAGKVEMANNVVRWMGGK